MQFGHVLALHLRDSHVADRGIDEQCHRSPVFLGGAGLAMDRDILLQESLFEFRHDRFGRSLGIAVARVDTLLRQGHDLKRRSPGLLKGGGLVPADGKQSGIDTRSNSC